MEFAVAEAPEKDGRITKHSTLFKTIMEITVIPRNSEKFAVAEDPGRDSRTTKHSTLLKTIIGIPRITQNSAVR